MAEKKPAWDLLSRESKDLIIRQIITYFQTEKELQLGILSAEEILDFFQKILSENIYNKALGDTKTIIKQNLDNLEVDLDLLFKK